MLLRTKKPILLLTLVLVMFLVLPQSNPSQADLIDPSLVLDPYEGVDWNIFTQHKANFHTHTDLGGARLDPAAVIDAYYAMGYSILALTDHDNWGSRRTTWPWQQYGRDPDELGMVAIEGNELSRQHHIGSYFNDFSGGIIGSIDYSLKQIGSKNGLAVFFHPGRYTKPGDWSFYKQYFHNYSHLLGIEVFNQGDRYPSDRLLWDNLLTEFMPERPIWGFSNDDMHRKREMGRNWNTFVLEELNENTVRQAMVSGQFYSTYQPGQTPAPVIEEIIIEATSITIEANGYNQINWISQGKIIYTGKTLDYKSTPGVGVYIRAQIKGEGGITLTNPFGFVCEAVTIH